MAIHAPLACLVTAIAVVAGAPAAQAYTFGEPGVSATGPEVRVYDWTTQKCNNDDIPDQATRAFRDLNNQVVLVNSHHTTRRYQGPTLATVTHNCSVMMGSGKNADPSMFDDREWLATTWTSDGGTVYGLIHSEYQGYNHGPGLLHQVGRDVRRQAEVLVQHAHAHEVDEQRRDLPTRDAAEPLRRRAGVPIRARHRADRIFPAEQHRARQGRLPLPPLARPGLRRTAGRQLPDAEQQHRRPHVVADVGRKWRRLHAPEPEPLHELSGPAHATRVRAVSRHGDYVGEPHLEHVLQEVDAGGRWQGLGAAPYPDSGFYYFTSDDLVNWSPQVADERQAAVDVSMRDRTEQVRDPSLLDNDSTSRNFDTTGQRPFIYFTRFNLSGCFTSLDRDLIRIPLEFSNQQPGGPAAALSASTRSPSRASTVTFDASESSDNGEITAFKWDLDGDGTTSATRARTPSRARPTPRRTRSR